MNSTTRVAINEVVESIDNLDRVLSNDDKYQSNILCQLKECFGHTVERIVREEAEYAHSQIMEEGYIDDVSRIRKLLGIAHEDEYNV